MRALLLQLRRIGDLVLTTPAIAALREQLRAEITLAVGPGAAPLLPAIDGIEGGIVVDGSGQPAWRQVRRGGFDCVIDFTRNDRSAFLTAVSGARQRIVSDRLRRKSRFRALFYNEFVDCAMKEMHTVDYHLALLRPLGISTASPEPVLTLPREAVERAENLIARWRPGPFAIFHPGSARPEKFWKPRRWAEVIAYATTGLRFTAILSAGSDPVENAHVAEIRRELRVPVIDLAGKLDLLTLAALIERASLLVTLDSAPMHLANASRTPQVILFGPTNPFHWRPRSSPALICRGNNSAPVRHFEPVTPKFGTSLISTAAVIDAMRSLMSAPAASAV